MAALSGFYVEGLDFKCHLLYSKQLFVRFLGNHYARICW